MPVQTVQPKTVQRAATARAAAAPQAVQRSAAGTPRVQAAGLRVSSPHDASEREAVATARRVMRMTVPDAGLARFGSMRHGTVFRQAPDAEREEKKRKDEEREIRRTLESPYVARFAASGVFGAAPGAEIRRQAEGTPNVAPNVAAEIQGAATAGEPLPLSVRRFMEPRFRADFSAVRIHTGDRAAALNRQLGARAFAFGDQIFFGREQFRPETAEGRELIAHELTHTIQQGAAVQRSEEVSVTETAPVQVQRLGIGDALSYFADRANHIPGFRMFTIVLGVNPINMSRVDRSASNILRAVVEFIPGGGLITQALENHGLFDRVGGWVEQQIRTLGMTGAVIRDAITRFLDSLSWRDVFDLGGVWSRARRIFSEPIDRIIGFVRGLVSGILGFVREAVLRPLAGLAARTRGYDLLKAVLGQDPITGDPYPRNADTLIGGFMKLIGQEEVWANIKRANAVARAWAWFQGAIAGLLGFVRQVPRLFLQALQALGIGDLVLLPRAFARIGAVFLDVAGRFFSWAGAQVMGLLQIIFEVVAPGVMPYLRRAGGAFRSIVQNPVGFVRNLVRAGILGFRQFAARSLIHLRTSLIGWLTGALGGTGVHIPQAFTLQEIIKFVLSVLGLTWQSIRQRLVRVVGEPAVRALETGFELVTALVTRGPAAAWERIQEGVANLREMVMEQIMAFVQSRIVQAAITRLVSSLNPAGAFVQAVIAIYNTIMFFVERLRQIAQVATAFVDSLSAIAGGVIVAAATRVEQTMGGLLTLVISFLARLVGLGNVSQAVTGVVARVRAPIERALDRVVDWIVAQARRLGRLVVQAGVPQDPRERLRVGLDAAERAVNALSGTVVTAPAIAPVLAALRVRFGFAALDARVREGTWWVEGHINPTGVRRTRKSAAERAADAAASISAGDLIVMRHASGWTNSNPRAVTSVSPTHVHYGSGGMLSKSTYGRAWRRFDDRASLWPLERIVAANHTNEWSDYTTANRVLNYRYHEFQLNPPGKQWEHIVEQSYGRRTGENVNSVGNLALTDGGFNRWLGEVFGRTYVRDDIRGFPSTGGRPLREFLLAQPVSEHRRWKEAIYRLEGKTVRRMNGPRGPYQVL